MKGYICDLCKEGIVAPNDPYKMNMREFFVGVAIESYGLLPENSSRRQKIHLCGNCFEWLCKVVKIGKNNPQSPIEDGYVNLPCVCPNCGTDLSTRISENFCFYCGQKLNWSERDWKNLLGELK